MKYVALVLVLGSAHAFADSDEALVEQLIHRPAAAAKAPIPRPAKADPAAALVGQAVRARTIDRGLYLGTLTAVDASAIHLDIVASGQTLAYALPRMATAGL